SRPRRACSRWASTPSTSASWSSMRFANYSTLTGPSPPGARSAAGVTSNDQNTQENPMSTTRTKNPKRVTVAIDPRRYRGLEWQADLLTRVFGAEFTPEIIVQDLVDTALATQAEPRERGRRRR